MHDACTRSAGSGIHTLDNRKQAVTTGEVVQHKSAVAIQLASERRPFQIAAAVDDIIDEIVQRVKIVQKALFGVCAHNVRTARTRKLPLSERNSSSQPIIIVYSIKYAPYASH